MFSQFAINSKVIIKSNLIPDDICQVSSESEGSCQMEWEEVVSAVGEYSCGSLPLFISQEQWHIRVCSSRALFARNKNSSRCICH